MEEIAYKFEHFFWNTLRMNNQSSSNSDIIEDVVNTDPQETKNAINYYFSGIPGTLNSESYLENAIPEQPILSLLDQNELEAIMNGLK